MENPYASISKVNPRTADGHREISNAVYWELLKVPISGAELRVALTVYDRAQGYGHTSAKISLSTIQVMTGLRRDSVVSAIKQLKESHMIVVSHGTGGAVNEYMFNVHYDTWLINRQEELNLDIPASTELGTSTEMGTSNQNRTSPSSRLATPEPEANSRGSTRTRTSPRVERGARRVNKTLLKITIKDNYFARFWETYPKKLARGAAEKAFLKLKVDDELFGKIVSAIELAKRSEQWTENGGQFIPYPATWINQKRWEDEYPEVKHGATRRDVPSARGVSAQRHSTTDEQRDRGASGAQQLY